MRGQHIQRTAIPPTRTREQQLAKSVHAHPVRNGSPSGPRGQTDSCIVNSAPLFLFPHALPLLHQGRRSHSSVCLPPSSILQLFQITPYRNTPYLDCMITVTLMLFSGNKAEVYDTTVLEFCASLSSEPSFRGFPERLSRGAAGACASAVEGRDGKARRGHELLRRVCGSHMHTDRLAV